MSESYPATAAPSQGGVLAGKAIGVLQSTVVFPKFVEDLELTSLIFSFDNSTGDTLAFQIQWLDGEFEIVASAITPILESGLTAGRITFGKHFQQTVVTDASNTSHVQAGLPVDTIITRNTILQVVAIIPDPTQLGWGNIRYRLRRDRDRTEVLGKRT